MSPSELQTWAVSDTNRLSLIASTVQAALSSLDQVKARTLAHVAAEAVEDDAKLDVANLMIRTLGELEPPHIQVLKAMCTEVSPPSASGEQITPGGRLLSTLSQRFPFLVEGLLPIMVTLDRLALVFEGLAGTRQEDGGPDRAWGATEYGEQLLSYLARSATELGPGVQPGAG
jgi:hypothetical protein